MRWDFAPRKELSSLNSYLGEQRSRKRTVGESHPHASPPFMRDRSPKKSIKQALLILGSKTRQEKANRMCLLLSCCIEAAAIQGLAMKKVSEDDIYSLMI